MLSGGQGNFEASLIELWVFPWFLHAFVFRRVSQYQANGCERFQLKASPTACFQDLRFTLGLPCRQIVSSPAHHSAMKWAWPCRVSEATPLAGVPGGRFLGICADRSDLLPKPVLDDLLQSSMADAAAGFSWPKYARHLL